jgi:hypothetical protein
MAARMAPKIDATYRRIERTIGAEFSARLQQALDQLLATLQADAPRRADGAASIGIRKRRRRSAAGRRTRGAVQQQLAEGRSYEQA